jgi:hypothetical protein
VVEWLVPEVQLCVRTCVQQAKAHNTTNTKQCPKLSCPGHYSHDTELSFFLTTVIPPPKLPSPPPLALGLSGAGPRSYSPSGGIHRHSPVRAAVDVIRTNVAGSLLSILYVALAARTQRGDCGEIGTL